MLFSTSIISATFLLASTLAAPAKRDNAPLVINSSNITMLLGDCDATITWSGGNPPYFPFLIQGRTPSITVAQLFYKSAMTYETSANYRGSQYCALGNVVQFIVKDSDETVAASELLTVIEAPEPYAR